MLANVRWRGVPAAAHRQVILVSFALLLFNATPASADAGLPMIAVYLPPAWLALFPIVLLEAAFGISRFKLPVGRSLLAQLTANCFSTLIGIPVVWVVLATVEATFFGTALGLGSPARRLYAVTVQAPWLIPYEEDMSWMVPASVLVLTVPFYALSIVSEYFVVVRFFPALTKSTVWSWGTLANAMSYTLLLAIIGGVWLLPEKLQSILDPTAPIIVALAEFVLRVASLFHAK